MSDPFHFDTDLHPKLIAEGLAREPWSKEFFEQLKASHETRYEQWGQLLGTVSIDSQESIQLRLCGMRDHCFGERNWTKYRRYIALMGHADDGTFFHVGAVCIPQSTTQ